MRYIRGLAFLIEYLGNNTESLITKALGVHFGISIDWDFKQ